jgi:hypothetical protein
MPAYVDFDPTQPDAASDAGTPFGADLLNNQAALRDAMLLGLFKGYAYAQSGGTAERPGVVTLTKSAHIIRATLTWADTGGGRFNVTAINWERSIDTGANWDTVQNPITLTYDGSGNLTATSGGGGLFAKFMQVWGMATKALADLTTHLAATGTAVHGLGSMSTQSSSSVAVTGGIDQGHDDRRHRRR